MEAFFVLYKPVAVIVHALSALLGIVLTLTTDALFFASLKDNKISKKESEILISISNFFLIILGIIILSGVALFFSNVDKYMVSSKFITKMLAVCVIMINGAILHKYISPRMRQINFTHRRYQKLKRVAFACGAVSVSSWLLSYILGSLSSIPFLVWQGICLYVCAVIFAVCMSQLFFDFRQGNIRKK